MSHSKYCGKILAIGDDSCGKTCLFTAFVRKQFPSLYIPTVFQGWASEITVDGSNVLLALVDTVSNEAYDHVRPLMFQDATIFLVCYSVDNLDSLQNVRSKYVQEMRQLCPGVPFILVGLKIDLRSDDAVRNELQTRKTNQSPVSFKQGLDTAEELGAFSYRECSALTGDGVDGVFEDAARASIAYTSGPKTYHRKLLIVGDASVGKTCLLYAYARKVFPTVYVPRVFEQQYVGVAFDDSIVSFVAWDTVAGCGEEYDRLRPLSYPGSDVIILAFAVHNRESFVNVRSKWIPEIIRYGEGAPYILVGLKIDLRNEKDSVTYAEVCIYNFYLGWILNVEYKGEAAAEAIGAYCYLECSASSGEGVERVFECAANASLAPKPHKPSKCTIL
ncbi:hypothetical protein HDU79_005533 [Rhizoclosmatium sp. JEL0117]|nr:hypothetical protein HDU79_005533 [Rhizoclosmatium sp. JEL0117]